MVSGKETRMGMGIALRLAGMGGNACLSGPCGSGKYLLLACIE
jgi:DNA replication protein DnaC